MLGTILIVIGMLLALLDAIVPTRPVWLLNISVILIGLGVLLGPTLIPLNK